ncbi:MAG: Asp-tRNA(Asn)/Glu-tRNA(Gln) amidotransferase subunit GatC [Spirochaetes bacterium]|nr:Asp-tRNA(Asn)/Glu-tRNA(Gln) amidotransferase subunit GatC [Spirochaetota bacterium]
MDLQELRITASLAYLDLEEEEFEKLQSAVEQLLQYFSKMMEVDIEGLPPTTHALVRENRTRPDQVLPFTDTDSLLENAPETEDRFIVIPNIL